MGRLRSVKAYHVFRKQEIRCGYQSWGSEKWMWPSQHQTVTSLTLRGKELPWAVFVTNWDPVDGANQKRDMISFACWKVSSLKIRSPLACFQQLSNPEGMGTSLPSKSLGDFRPVGPALPLVSHIPHAYSCTLGVLTHCILFNQVTIFWPNCLNQILGAGASRPP